MKDIQKEQSIETRYRYSYIYMYIRSSIVSSHKKEIKQTTTKKLTFQCQNRYNKYLQKKRNKTKQREYLYLGVFC